MSESPPITESRCNCPSPPLSGTSSIQRSTRSRTRTMVSFSVRVNSSHPKRSCAFFISHLLETEFGRYSFTGSVGRRCFLLRLFRRRVVRQHSGVPVGVKDVQGVGKLLLFTNCR